MPEITNNTANLPTTRDLLFGDLPLDQWAAMGNNEAPWSLFKEAKKHVDNSDTSAAVASLKKIIDLPGLESRQYLQAYYFLNELVTFSEEYVKLYGVVVEVGMSEGCDLLAVYEDYKARYYNYSGKAVIWENPDNSIDNKVDNILALGAELLKLIGPWQAERPAAPTDGNARINLLTSHGLHFGEGPVNVLFNDPKGGKILHAVQDLMQTLINKTN